jgi:hypothetical protein
MWAEVKKPISAWSAVWSVIFERSKSFKAAQKKKVKKFDTQRQS